MGGSPVQASRSSLLKQAMNYGFARDASRTRRMARSANAVLYRDIEISPKMSGYRHIESPPSPAP
eukprot:7257843-Pyramimonas_sp.AAC.1